MEALIGLFIGMVLGYYMCDWIDHYIDRWERLGGPDNCVTRFIEMVVRKLQNWKILGR